MIIPKQPDLERLFIFYRVCEGKTHKDVATSLNIKPSTLSYHISKLEEEIGFKLFNRQTRVLTLTEEGKSLYSHVKEFFSAYSAVSDFCGLQKKQTSSRLKIFGGENTLLTLIINSIQKFKFENPQIHLDIIGVNHIPTFSDYELAIGLLGPLNSKADVVQEYLFSFNLGLFASKNYLEKNGTPKTMEELSQHQLISFENHDIPFAYQENWLLTAHMPKFTKREAFLIINTVPLTYGACENSQGIVLMPKQNYFLMKSADIVEILPDISKPELPVYFTYHSIFKKHMLVSSFKKFILNELNSKGLLGS